MAPEYLREIGGLKENRIGPKTSHCDTLKYNADCKELVTPMYGRTF